MLLFTVIILAFFCYSLHVKTTRQYVFSIHKTNFLKAILPLFIIFHHTSNEQLADFIPAGKYIVAIFFFVSGYGLEIKRQSGKIDSLSIFKRFRSLLCPLFVPISVFLVIQYVHKVDVVKYVIESFSNIAFPLPHSWFVMVLLVLYMFYFSLSAFSSRHFLIYLFLAVAVLTLTFFVLFREHTHLYSSNFAFFIGACYCRYAKRFEPVFRSTAFPVIVSLLFITSYLLIQYRLVAIANIELYTLLVIAMLSSMPDSVFLRCNSILSFFKNISYELYICQGIAITLIVYDPMQHRIFYSLSVFIVSICVSFLCNRMYRLIFG